MSAPRLLVPLALEVRPVRRGAPQATIERIGMGPERATRSTRRILSSIHKPQPMVLLGVAGGLSREDRPGDIVVATELGTIDGDPSVLLKEATAVAALLAQEGLEVRQGAIVSAREIIHGAGNRRDAGRHGALAVDMESYWCAPIAAYHPFVVVRVLLDVPSAELRSRAVFSATRDAYRSLKAVSRTLASWSPVSVGTYPLPEVGES